MLITQSDIYFYALAILLYILYSIKKENRRVNIFDQKFVLILITTSLQIFWGGLAWLVNGVPGNLFVILNIMTNFCLFAGSFLPISIWFMYLDENIIGEQQIIRKRRNFYIGLNILLVLAVMSNFFSEVVFVIEAGNHYIRNIGVYGITIFNLLSVPVYILSILKYRQYIHGNFIQVLLTLTLLPLLGGFIQMIYYGTTLTWPLLGLVAIIAYFLIEREEMLKDSLTDLPMRGQLEQRLRFKLQRGQAFSLMMIDLDDFKIINDKMGHNKGDLVLNKVASILKESVDRVDKVYRYGGDEFIILIESADPLAADLLKAKIQEKIEADNEQKDCSYFLKMSMGSGFFDKKTAKSIFEILAEIDGKMYHDKNIHKQRKIEII